MRDKFKIFTRNAIKSVAEFPPIKTTAKNFKVGLHPAQKVSKLHLSKTQGVEPNYDNNIEGNPSQFQQDKETLAKGKTNSDFKQTTIVSKKEYASITTKVCDTIKANTRGIGTRKAEHKEYKTYLDNSVSQEQEIKQNHISSLNNEFSKYLQNKKPELAHHFNQYLEAKKQIDEIFNSLSSKEDSQLDRAIVFQDFVSDLTSVIVTNNKGKEINLDSLLEKYPSFAKIANEANMAEYDNNFKEAFTEFLENRKFYLNYDHNKLSQEIEQYKPDFMNTDSAKNINQKFVEDTTPIYATILQSKYKHIYNDSIRSLKDSLQYAGVDVNAEMKKLPRHNHVINKSLMPIDAITKSIGFVYGKASGSDGYENAHAISKQAKFSENAQQSHILSWQHSSAVSKQTLLIQQQMEKLSETLQAKFTTNPYIDELDSTTQGKIDSLEEKQNKRIQSEIKGSALDLKAHLGKLNDIIKSYNVDNSNSLKSYRNKLDFDTTIKKQIYLINKRANLCLNNLNTIKNEADVYRPDLAGNTFNDQLINFKSSLEILSNLKDIEEIPQDISIAFQIFQVEDLPKYSINQLRADQLSKNNIPNINIAIQREEKEEIRNLVSQLYGNNNSKNFKIALDTYLRKTDELITTHLRTIDSKDVSENLPKLKHWGNLLNKASLHTELQSKNANLHIESGMRKANKYVDNQLSNANSKIDNFFDKDAQNIEQEEGSKSIQSNADKLKDNIGRPAGKAIAKIFTGTTYGIVKSGVVLADVATKSIASTPKAINYTKDSIINTAKSTKWAAQELGERHLFGLAYPVKGIARIADNFNAKIPVITPLAKKLYKLDHYTQDTHKAKTNYGSMRGMVKSKQRERRSDNIADSLVQKLQVSYAIDKTEQDAKITGLNESQNEKNIPSINSKENVDNLFNYLRQSTRHMYSNTNITGFAKDRLFIEDMYADTWSKKISSYIHEKLHIGTTDKQKSEALNSFMQSYAGGKYTNDANGKININDPALLEAWSITAQNTNAQARFIAKAILSLVVPFKIGSNYVGVLIYTKTGSPIILAINAPGNPLDDAMVGILATTIGTISSLVANVFTKEFEPNRQNVIKTIQKSLYHNNLFDNQKENSKSDNIISFLTQAATAGITDGNKGIDLPDGLDSSKIVGYDEFIGELTSQVFENIEMNEEQKGKLQSLVDALDINKFNKSKESQGASPTKQEELPTEVQAITQAVANIPFLNDVRPKTENEIKNQTTTLTSNVSFAEQVKAPVLGELSEMYYSMMEKHASNLVAPASIPLATIAGLGYGIVATAADSMQTAGQLITGKDIKSTWGDSMSNGIKVIYKKLGDSYANRSNKADIKEQEKGIPAAKLNDKTGFSAKPRVFAAS